MRAASKAAQKCAQVQTSTANCMVVADLRQRVPSRDVLWSNMT